MEIRIENGTITGGEIFRLVWRGFFFFIAAVMTPLSIVWILVFSSQLPEDAWPSIIMVPVMFPIVGAFQGVIVGLFVLIGLTIRPPRRGNSAEARQRDGT